MPVWLPGRDSRQPRPHPATPIHRVHARVESQDGSERSDAARDENRATETLGVCARVTRETFQSSRLAPPCELLDSVLEGTGAGFTVAWNVPRRICAKSGGRPAPPAPLPAHLIPPCCFIKLVFCAELLLPCFCALQAGQILVIASSVTRHDGRRNGRARARARACRRSCRRAGGAGRAALRVEFVLHGRWCALPPTQRHRWHQTRHLPQTVRI
jgi:hypothetical protein